MGQIEQAFATTEINMLWASAVLGIVYLLAAVLPSVAVRGIQWALGPRDEPAADVGMIGGRLDRAWKNFLETFPIFVVAIIADLSLRGGSELGVLGAQLYFWSRVAFLPVYALGLPIVRTLVWTVSIIGIGLLLYSSMPAF
jgi:uncharacterized MAPEG superfamily protein